MRDGVDFGKTARDYGRYRAGFPETFFDRLSAFGVGQSGQRVLDLGTGTGTVAREFARRGCIPFIEDCVRRFRLDDEDLKAEQFIVLRREGSIVAFGRIKPYGRDVYELGCVAVVEEERRRGLGKQVVHELIRRFPVADVYITTDLPSYFEPLGFRRITDGPPEILAKIERVCGRLRSGVVAMAFRKQRAFP